MLSTNMALTSDNTNITTEPNRDELRALFSELSELAKTKSKEQEEALNELFVEQICRMIYGSNMIEFAGGSLETTRKLCRMVFDKEGEDVPEEITAKDPDYDDIRLHLQSRNLPHDHAQILQSYREIVQHAQAAEYIFGKVGKGEALSESIIKETHAILTYKIDIRRTPWIYYSGVYHTWNVRCGSHVFMDEIRAPFAMRDMVEALESDIEKDEIDLWELASKYCHRFVNIHPFGDGNGRMCRLVLNALLLRFGFGIVCIGQVAKDRRLYLRIAVESSALEASQNQEHMVMKNYKALASFVLQHTKDEMLKTCLTLRRDSQ
jgi:Fic family protein